METRGLLTTGAASAFSPDRTEPERYAAVCTLIASLP